MCIRDSAKSVLEKIALRDLELGVALKDAQALRPELQALGALALRARELFEARKDELAGLSYADVYKRQVAGLRLGKAGAGEPGQLPQLPPGRPEGCSGGHRHEPPAVPRGLSRRVGHGPVSYTHLDVYKRQSFYTP